MDNLDQENKPSFILIQFAGVASTVLQAKFENVTSLQVLAVAQYLELKGKNQLLIEENERAERERETSLAVPSGKGKILLGK